MDLARGRTALAVLCAVVLAVVDTTIVSIALPSIRSSLEFTSSGSQWVLVGGLAAVALAVAPWNSFALVITGIVVGETGFMLGVDGLASHHQSGAMPGR